MAQQQSPDQPGTANGQKPGLDDQVIHDVLEPLQTAIESHRLDQVLAVFDAAATPGYAQVRDQLTAFFRQYEPIRFRYKVLQVSSDKDQGFAVAEVDMAASPADQNVTPIQRSTQMRFQMKLLPKGWKLVGFMPPDFFSQP